ncbi:tetratricopeptide repeat protein [Halobaculum limi]|uniref:tetratricopeptide repeat protein n=1 Tax=Halobaculum limi TaxID=3031916 RepID=UPI0024060DAB|nr:tetratricopeptide repeat protein [Halobaculum sp. YSMS11]
MTRTNLSRCSRLTAVLAVIALLLAAVAPAAAVSVGQTDVPEEGEVGSQVTATVTLTELYDTYETWQLAGSTGLQDVTWTVTFVNQAGNQVRQESFDGQNFSGATVDINEGTAEVRVRVTGTVPEIEEYSYDPQQSFTLFALDQTREGGTSNALSNVSAAQYTGDSQEAREALESARSAIDAAGNPDTAEESFASAVNAYEAGNFDNAVTLAERAETEANQAESSQQQTQLIIYGVAAVVVLALVAGGVFLFLRSRDSGYDKLG